MMAASARALLLPLISRVKALLEYFDTKAEAVLDNMQMTGFSLYGLRYPLAAAGFLTLAAGFYFFVHTLRALIKYTCPRLLPSGNNLRGIQGWAIVTGCTDGQGKQWALELAGMGKDLILVGRNFEKLQQTEQHVKRVNNFIQTVIIVADFKEAGRLQLFERIRQEIGERDVGILINNVGQFVDYFKPMLEHSLQETLDQFNVNVNAMLFMTRIVLPHMVNQRGLQRPSCIVNICSATGYVGLAPIPLMNIYSSTKGFVRYMSVALDREYRERSGITVMCVHPFLVRTSMVKGIRRLGFGWATYLVGLSPETFVPSILPTIGIGRETFGHWFFGVQNLFSSLIPSWVPSSLWARMAQS